MKWSTNAYCIILCIHGLQATVSVDFDEDIRDCGTGAPLPSVDISRFQILPQPDGSIVLNGTARLTKDYGSPTTWRMYSQKLQRGKWEPGLLSRDVPNLCAVLQVPTEPWYVYTKHLEKKNCPYKAGHEDHMDMVNLGNLGSMFDVPPQMIGEWRIYHEITTTRNGLPVRECVMLPTTISEV